MKTILFVLTCFIAQSAFAAQESKDFDAKDLKTLTIMNLTGKVNISAGKDSKATVATTKNKFSDQCKLTEELTNGALLVKVEQLNHTDGDCDVDVDVKLPKKVDLDLMSGTGKVKVNGIHGSLTFKLGTNDLIADGEFTKIDGKAGTGKIDIKGLVGTGDIKQGTGDVNLSYSKVPASGSIDIKLGTGSAKVAFPKGSKVKSDFVSATGQLKNELGDSADATFTVSMKSGTGSLTIKTN